MLFKLPQVEGATTLTEAIKTFYLLLLGGDDNENRVECFAKTIECYVLDNPRMQTQLVVNAMETYCNIGSVKLTLPGVQIKGLPTGRSIMVTLAPSTMDSCGKVIWLKATKEGTTRG